MSTIKLRRKAVCSKFRTAFGICSKCFTCNFSHSMMDENLKSSISLISGALLQQGTTQVQIENIVK